MTEDYVLSIDQGTTSSRVLIFDRRANVKGSAYSEFTQHYPKPGWVEHDAAEIWNGTLGLLSEVLEKSEIPASRLNAIGIANQRETTVMWDRNTGKPVARAIVWQDRRTAPFCDALKAKGLEEMIRSKTGLVTDPYFSGTKVKWLLDNVEGLRERASKGEIAFGTIDSWLIWHLTGGKIHATDYSNASRTLLFNIHDQTWDEDLLNLFDIPASVLPEVRPSSHVYGQTNPELFFGTQGIPVAGSAGDQQAALFGQACFGKGHAKNTYGTGSFVLMNTGTEAVMRQGKAADDHRLEDRRRARRIRHGRRHLRYRGGGPVATRRALGIVREAAETEALAESLISNEGVYFVPALVGLGAPHWDSYARGTLLGVTRGTTKAHIARAVLESICYQTRDVVDAMQRDSGIPLKELRCDGGASVNGFLMQYQSDILGVPVEVPEVAETTALGAAYLAGLATGYWSGRAEIEANWRLSRRYVPSLSEDQRAHVYGRWLEAVKRAKDWAREEGQ